MKSERIVLVLAAVLFLWFLGAHDLWAPDEPFFGEGAREMLIDGQWLVTHVNGVVNSHKPPLFFWLIAIFSIPFGAVTEFTARLPSVLAALGTLALVMRLGRRWYGPKTAVLAGVLLATSYMFWDKARWSQIDSLLCFLIWVALSAFDAWRSGGADGRRAGALFWLAAGLAVLAKGPVGLLLPLGVVVLVLAVERDLGSLRRFAPLLGPALFVLVTGAWALAATFWGPAEYSVVGALREHFVERGMHGMHHVQPFWYYAERLPLSLLPWTALLPGALVLAWRDRRRSVGQRMSLATALFVVVFFSLSTEKRDLYVLPAFPAIALMMAVMVGGIAGRREGFENVATLDRRWVTIGQVVVGGLFTLVAVAVPFAGGRVESLPAWMVYLLGAVFLITGVVVLVTALRGRALDSVIATSAGMVVLYLVATALVYPAMESRKSSRSFALETREITAASRAEGHRVVAWRAGNIPIAVAFYSDGLYTVETDDVDVLARHLRQDALVYAIVRADQIDEVPVDVRENLTVLYEQRLSRKDLALVANRRQ
jgi:4-amino-4-deoxy-L-arabinose transferase-like glycosyltransferase